MREKVNESQLLTTKQGDLGVNMFYLTREVLLRLFFSLYISKKNR